MKVRNIYDLGGIPLSTFKRVEKESSFLRSTVDRQLQKKIRNSECLSLKFERKNRQSFVHLSIHLPYVRLGHRSILAGLESGWLTSRKQSKAGLTKFAVVERSWVLSILIKASMSMKKNLQPIRIPDFRRTSDFTSHRGKYIKLVAGGAFRTTSKLISLQQVLFLVRRSAPQKYATKYAFDL